MPATLTIKNIPEDIYARLKTAAARHRRSINSEAIVCLEQMLIHDRGGAEERVQRARQLRSRVSATFQVDEIDALKRNGRP